MMKDSDDGSKKDSTGVTMLLGDPKTAIIKLSVPMIVAMSAQTIYNFVDAIWVSGLGADALAAIGFVFPFFFAAMGLSNGLGIGGGSAISRKIGARDKRGADNVAVHTIIIMLVAAAVFTVPLFTFAEELFVSIGAGGTTGMAVTYARIIFAGSILIFFTNIANAMLRAEGDARRAMYVIALGAALNIENGAITVSGEVQPAGYIDGFCYDQNWAEVRDNSGDLIGYTCSDTLSNPLITTSSLIFLTPVSDNYRVFAQVESLDSGYAIVRLTVFGTAYPELPIGLNYFIINR